MNTCNSPVPDSYLAAIARRLTGDHSQIDDLIQEGRIEVWAVSQKTPVQRRDPKIFYGKVAMRRMQEIINGRRPIGAEHSLNKHHTDVTDLPGLLYLDASQADADGPVLAELIPAPDRDNDMACHRTEIIAAIRRLPEDERRYVYDRFWLGKAAQELPRIWLRIRLKLARELAHLESAVS